MARLDVDSLFTNIPLDKTIDICIDSLYKDDVNSPLWCYGVVVITTVQLHSTKPELRFCTGSNPACGLSEICDGEDL